jgi:hypothetical protein
MIMTEFGFLQEVHNNYVLGDGWSQQISQPIIVVSHLNGQNTYHVTWVVLSRLWYGTFDEVENTLVTCK